MQLKEKLFRATNATYRDADASPRATRYTHALCNRLLKGADTQATFVAAIDNRRDESRSCARALKRRRIFIPGYGNVRSKRQIIVSRERVNNIYAYRWILVLEKEITRGIVQVHCY